MEENLHEEDACLITLDQFRGPLTLLLHLINKEQIDILDLPIAKITAQYLDYLELMRALNIAIAGEYLVMAATLMLIKSKMLLPRPEPEDPEDDPRLEIVRPLLQLSTIQEAAQFLDSREWLERDVFARDGFWEIQDDAPNPASEEEPLAVDLLALVEAFRQALEKSGPDDVYGISGSRMRVRDRIEAILVALRAQGKLHLSQLLAAGSSRAELIVTLLAILELVKAGQARIHQEAFDSDIIVSAAAAEAA